MLLIATRSSDAAQTSKCRAPLPSACGHALDRLHGGIGHLRTLNLCHGGVAFSMTAGFPLGQRSIPLFAGIVIDDFARQA